MKAIFALLFVALATSAYSSQLPEVYYGNREIYYDTPEERLGEEEIKGLVKCISGILKNGVEIGDIKIPPLDPLVVKQKTIPVNLPDVSGTINLIDVEFKGFSDLDFPVLKGSIGVIPPGFNLQYKAVSPSIQFVGTIELDLVVKGKTIKETIKLDASYKNLSFQGKLRVGLNKKLAAFHVEIDLDKIDINGLDGIEGAQDIVEIIKNLPAFLKENKKAISKVIDDWVMQKASGRSRAIDIGAIIKEILNSCKK